MQFDLDRRRAHMGVGEFSDFSVGPRDPTGGPSGLWRARLGSRWHRELRESAAEAGESAEFEIGISGEVGLRGWILVLTGRIDQVVRGAGPARVREIKTVTRPLPAPEAELRAEYPSYFIQLATYAALREGASSQGAAEPGAVGRGAAGKGATERFELVFVEADTGLSQTVVLTAQDRGSHAGQLARVVEFLDLRLRARERLRGLQFRAPFRELRPGQETIQTDLRAAVLEGRSAVLFDAPTGFGKTGVLLEFVLRELRDGRFERALYLTGKSTGQLQVVATLAAMTAPGPDLPPGIPVAAWHVRNKGEHCVNSVFHCTRESCRYLDGQQDRWSSSGLARFYLLEGQARDLETLRSAGRQARICPYEITRAALAFNELWIGDFNYIFSPDSSGLFRDQPGFLPGHTLLIVDEAHNLPSRVADAHSHRADAAEAHQVADLLFRVRAPSRTTHLWRDWAEFLGRLEPADALPDTAVEEARKILALIAEALANVPLDSSALEPRIAEAVWRTGRIHEQLDSAPLARLWWCPKPGQLAITCLDAAPVIGAALREFGGVILSTATPGPTDVLAEACGLSAPVTERPSPSAPRRGERPEPPGRPERPARLGELGKRETRKIFTQLLTGAELLRVGEEAQTPPLAHLRPATPWRDGAYAMAVDLRVDTTFQHRLRHLPTTATTVAALCAASGTDRSIAAFFPSYAYAESVSREIAASRPDLRIALQPRLRELSEQAAWVGQSLGFSDALFLVLGSSFTEGIDLLGGRVTHALVVGPALPEVNPVQRAKLSAFGKLGREAAVDRVYAIPGMQKVNQALGRLVRAPGHGSKVLLHCRRFAEPRYARLLAPEYRTVRRILDDGELEAWLA